MRLEATGMHAKDQMTKNEKLLALEAGMMHQMEVLRKEKDNEIQVLLAKIDLLEQKVAALLASKSTRRSYLYWSGIAAHKRDPSARRPRSGNDATHASIDALGLADPACWEEDFRGNAMFEATRRQGEAPSAGAGRDAWLSVQ